jgi:tetrapyrrole methylase family protein/MazG family protein
LAQDADSTVPKSRKKNRKPQSAPRKKASVRKFIKSRTPGSLFEDLLKLQKDLLAPNGCPWDREQTHESLRTYLIEEAYEVLDALDSGDADKFAEELGDLLLQIVFHSQLAAQAGRFEISDVIERVHTKMVRRHPHVFGRAKANTSAQVLKNWEHLKAEERKLERTSKGLPVTESAENLQVSLLDGIPRTLPAVLEGYQLARRAARVGFDWQDIGGVLEKLREEISELEAEIARGNSAEIESEAGDLLFAAVNVARFLKLDPEIALKKANRKFVERFHHMEGQVATESRKLADCNADELDALWNRAKLHGKPESPQGMKESARKAAR